ncbi:MAG: TonB family protein [Blastocatellia bacterium]|nr:TonB family protein [Blastocatellia bacterium]
MSSRNRLTMIANARNRSFLPISLIVTLSLCAGAMTTAAQVPVPSARAPESLLSELKSDDAVVRRAAANQLGSLRARDGVRQLIAALADKDVTVREAAAFALGQIADPSATEPLVRALTDNDFEVRASAAFALGMLGGSKATEAISFALADADPAVRASAATAIGLMRDEGGVDEIIELLNDSSFDTRYDAVWALGQIGTPDAIDHLRVALVGLDALRMSEPLREVFRQTVQNSIENIRFLNDAEIDSSGRPRPDATAGGKSKGEQNRAVSILKTVAPAPTERALRFRVSGTVGARVLVSTSGRPTRAYVTRRLGYGLDQRAVEAVMQYRFDPAVRNGISQTGWIDLDIKF